MVHEGDDETRGDDEDAQRDAGAQNRADRRLDPLHVHGLDHQPAIPFTSICSEMMTSVATKRRRTMRFSMRVRRRDPRNAPARTPIATGAAMNGSTSPRLSRSC